MNVHALQIDKQAAADALKEYRAHRDVYDNQDREIERIYRQIARGNTVISLTGSITRAGLDDQGRPRLAVCLADCEMCRCDRTRDLLEFSAAIRGNTRKLRIPYPGMRWGMSAVAVVPRIPPQHRPQHHLSNYHLLWEAAWEDIPADPMLLRRIGKDAWVVLAAWDLTEVELSVLRAHRAEGAR